MEVRPFCEGDRAGALALGGPVVDAWHARHPALHLVAVEGARIVGHLQVADRGVPGSRGEGRGDLILRVAPGSWEGGLPGRLLDRAVRFARARGLDRLAASYLATEPALKACLEGHGFVPFERYLPSRLRLDAFDPARFATRPEGVRLLTYADAGDTPENRRGLYGLDRAARAVQPSASPARTSRRLSRSSSGRSPPRDGTTSSSPRPRAASSASSPASHGRSPASIPAGRGAASPPP